MFSHPRPRVFVVRGTCNIGGCDVSDEGPNCTIADIRNNRRALKGCVAQSSKLPEQHIHNTNFQGGPDVPPGGDASQKVLRRRCLKLYLEGELRVGVLKGDVVQRNWVIKIPQTFGAGGSGNG